MAGGLGSDFGWFFFSMRRGTTEGRLPVLSCCMKPSNLPVNERSAVDGEVDGEVLEPSVAASVASKAAGSYCCQPSWSMVKDAWESLSDRVVA